MQTQYATRRDAQGMSRRGLLKAGVAASVTLSAWPFYQPAPLWVRQRDHPGVAAFYAYAAGIRCTLIRI